MEDSGRFLARIPRGLGFWRIREGSQPEYLGGQGYGGFAKVPSQNTQGVRVMQDSGRFLARMHWGLGLCRIREGSQPESLGCYAFGCIREGVLAIENLGGQGFGGFGKVPSQNTVGVRLMEDSGRFLARILRGLGLWRIQEHTQPEYIGGQDYGGFGKVLGQNTLGVRVMEDSGRFLAIIPRGLGLWRIREGSQPEYLGGKGYGGFVKVRSQNTQGVRVMEDSGRFLARILIRNSTKYCLTWLINLIFRGWLVAIYIGMEINLARIPGLSESANMTSVTHLSFLARIPRGLGVMEDSGRFLARILPQ